MNLVGRHCVMWQICKLTNTSCIQDVIGIRLRQAEGDKTGQRVEREEGEQQGQGLWSTRANIHLHTLKEESLQWRQSEELQGGHILDSIVAATCRDHILKVISTVNNHFCSQKFDTPVAYKNLDTIKHCEQLSNVLTHSCINAISHLYVLHVHTHCLVNYNYAVALIMFHIFSNPLLPDTNPFYL